MSDATTQIERPAFGPQGEPCANCGALLARDQRYCLECGTRRAGMAAMLSAPPRAAAREAEIEPAAVVAGSPWRLDSGLLAGVGCLLLALLVGVLIGRSGGDDGAPRASAPQVISVPGAASAGTAAAATFVSDWPAGKRGFTVQLQALPKASSDPAKVATAKQAASANGAPGVGALDSDAYGTLDPGAYVVFSGTYADRKAAQAALGKLKGAFPGATVVEVAETRATAGASPNTGAKKERSAAAGKTKKPSAAEQAAGAQAIKDIQDAAGKDYSKKSAKLPDKLATPGEAPPKDLSKPAGGGSDTLTFP